MSTLKITIDVKQEIKRRIASLRTYMKDVGISAFITPSTDPHAGEYTPEHWESRKWISGFTGSAGTAVVTLHNGGVWTDSRYFLQAEEQLTGTGLSLFKDRLPDTPSIATWLGSVLNPGDVVGIDGWVMSTLEAMELKRDLENVGLQLKMVADPYESLWTNRPSLPTNPLIILPEQLAGVVTIDKLTMIRESLDKYHVNGILISALDEIAWTLNLRGNDVHCNPVFVSYLLVTQTSSTLYIDKRKITDRIQMYLEINGVETRPYQDIANDLQQYANQSILIPESVNFALYSAIPSHIEITHAPSPISLLKAVKNEIEIAGFHAAMHRDGIAMVRFIKWLKEAVKSGNETEVSIDKKLYQLRAAHPYFKGISFDTIAGYQQHGAIVHYEATLETAYTLKPEGLLLLDSGAQYLDGTTDITRTIVLGPVTEAQKKDYTLVLKGFINLSMAVFPHGTCGTQLDILARQAMWKEGVNYGHGTGHGVGHFLNVHEGPHQIRMNYVPTPLLPGMTVTNEPGIYKTDEYGIRTENTMIVTKAMETDFGIFYQFEPLTLCPIDKEAIVPKLLTKEEKVWFNLYHERVFRELAPELTTEEQIWLQQTTSPI